MLTSNQAALLATSQPQQQSGQASIREIHNTIHALKQRGNRVRIVWVASHGDFELSRKAKEAARQATGQGQEPQEQFPQMKSTTIQAAIAAQKEKKVLPKGIGRYSREMDTALPGRHTHTLYNDLDRREANVLAQLRTGMARLNGYLHQIGRAESDQCACGQARETVKHFLFRCTRWDLYRTQMLAQTDTRRGNLSFYLGGKAPSDPQR